MVSEVVARSWARELMRCQLVMRRMHECLGIRGLARNGLSSFVARSSPGIPSLFVDGNPSRPGITIWLRHDLRRRRLKRIRLPDLLGGIPVRDRWPVVKRVL